MSDLFQTRKKVEDGAKWRGEINVSIDGETDTLCVRQLPDSEFWEVMSLIDTDELNELQESLPDEQMEEYQELKEKEGLTDGKQNRLETLQAEIENSDVDMFDVISTETFEGIRKAAKYGVEPDDEDKRDALAQFTDEIRDQYGAATHEEAAKYINNTIIHPMINQATSFTSFTIGIKCLTETIGDTGNLDD